jgi:type I restriction enzyme S subunit
MKKYKFYSAYKPSSVKWLGDIPKDWDLRKLKYIAHLFYGDSLPVESRDDGDVPVYGSNGVVGSHSVANTLAPCLIVGRKGSYGKVAFSNQCAFAIDTAYFIDRRTIQTTLNFKWLFYALSSLELDQQSQDTGVPGLSREFAHNKLLPFPSLKEQELIATFLDRETTHIDTLINKKSELINLLQHKHTIIITNAVTKGIEPNVLMKDSGVAWIGEVPKHWQVKRIKFVCRLETGHTPNRSEESYWIEEECTIPWVSLNDTKTLAVLDYISETKYNISPTGMANSSARLIEPGAVVFTRDATIGLAAITTKFMAVSQHIIAWVCLPGIYNQFLLNIIYAMKNELEKLTMGSTIKTIGMTDIKDLRMPIPPLEEQIKIVDKLNREKQIIEKAITKIEEQINELEKYRQALITAAVTGKIDVREEVERGAA